MTTTLSTYDAMLVAVDLARKSRFLTAPNPCVGAVLLRDGVIVASGRHKAFGGPHAEVEALADAGAKGVNPADCTMVVTLEPCAHHGKTPPCTEAIVRSGIRHVVIGMLDPNQEAGGGVVYLREQGIVVDTGVAEDACREILQDFITWQTTPLPYTILKLASTLDGRIATRTGHSKWITCESTRRRVHQLRRHMGAVIVGGNTFYQDNPLLTCRAEPGEATPEKQPLAVIVTSRLPAAELPCPLLTERPTETIFWTTVAAAASPKAEALRRIGVRVLGLQSQPRPNGKGHGMRAELDLAEGLAALRQDHGCHYVLCEGGGRLGLSLLHKGLAHELHLHLAPIILGDNEATALFDGLSPLQIDEALRMRFVRSELSDADIILTLQSNPPHICPEDEQGKR